MLQIEKPPFGIFKAEDFAEGVYTPFISPYVFEDVEVEVPLRGVGKIKKYVSQTVYYAHSGEEKEILTSGVDKIPVQEVLDEYKKRTGKKVDMVITCNPHSTPLSNCGKYITGSPDTLFSNRNGKLKLNISNNSGTGFKLKQGK